MMQETITKAISQNQHHKELVNGVQYLSFTLDNEEYGVDILRVQEIRSWEPVSRIPNVPHYEKGVVNLRGSSCRLSICGKNSASNLPNTHRLLLWWCYKPLTAIKKPGRWVL